MASVIPVIWAAVMCCFFTLVASNRPHNSSSNPHLNISCSPCHCRRSIYPGFTKSKALIADCSRRGLTQIPDNLPDGIQVLILSHNPQIALSQSPQEPYKYHNLTVLVMHECDVRFLNLDAFEGLTSLEVLDLHSARVGVTMWSPMASAKLGRLSTLNVTVGDLPLNSTPFRSTHLKRLRELNIRFLSNFSERIFIGLRLTTLRMTVETAMYLPENILQPIVYSDLKNLYINSKSLRAIPEKLLKGFLRSLEVFHLTATYITRLPSNLFIMNRGEWSDDEREGYISYDWFDETGQEIDQTTDLTEIWITGVSSITPYLFKDLSALRRLVIKQFHDISDNAFRGLSLLEELTLANSDSFSEVSKYLLKKLYELTYLKISKTQIHTLKDEELEDISELVYLDLSDNKLQHIDGYTFWFMHELERLDLSRNQFEKFHQTLFEIGSLVTLDISYNKLSQLHEEIFTDLDWLHELNLCGNELKSLPEGIFDSLYSIHWLDLSQNNFLNFSVSYIEECTELAQLDLSYNCIQKFNMEELKDNHPDLEVNLVENPMLGEDTCMKTNSVQVWAETETHDGHVILAEGGAQGVKETEPTSEREQSEEESETADNTEQDVKDIRPAKKSEQSTAATDTGHNNEQSEKDPEPVAAVEYAHHTEENKEHSDASPDKETDENQEQEMKTDSMATAEPNLDAAAPGDQPATNKSSLPVTILQKIMSLHSKHSPFQVKHVDNDTEKLRNYLINKLNSANASELNSTIVTESNNTSKVERSIHLKGLLSQVWIAIIAGTAASVLLLMVLVLIVVAQKKKRRSYDVITVADQVNTQVGHRVGPGGEGECTIVRYGALKEDQETAERMHFV